MATTIAVFGVSSGVGKTSIARNLAAALAVAEKDVLLVDLDPRNSEPRRIAALKPRLFYNQPQKTSLERLQILPAQADLLELDNLVNDAFLLREALNSRGCEFYILDCPPFLGQFAIQALNAADLVFIPCEADPLQLSDLSFALQAATTLPKQTPAIEILFNKMKKNVRLQELGQEEIMRHCAGKTCPVLLPESAQVVLTDSERLAILARDIRDPLSVAYISLAAYVLKNREFQYGRTRSFAVKSDVAQPRSNRSQPLSTS